MKALSLSLFALFFALSAQALECPMFQLECEVLSLSESGTKVVTNAASVGFEGGNDDEPSLPPTECRASVRLPSMKKGISLHVTVVGTTELTAFLYAFEKYGVVGNQAYMEIKPGQRFALTFGAQDLRCELVEPGNQD